MKDITISTKFYRWLFLLICLSSWKKLADSKEVRIVCYYTNWSVYRPGEAKFSPQNINPYLCTHLVYAFGGFTKENTLKPFDKYQDIEKGGYAKFTGLKTYNKNLKTLIAIGGWNEGSSRFSPMVASPERRKELVKNTVKFLRQNHFDGLDLDWEYPTFRDGGKSRDKENYAKLVKELREEFERESEKTGRSRLLLTMAVPAGIEYINKGYDVPKLMKYLDWMNILSYDYHSAFEPAVNHHAPLYALEEESEYNYDTELNIDHTIKHYLENGAIPDKLVLGIPTYGRSYTLFNPDANELGAPADGPGDMGEATRENGYLAYYEICDYVKNQDWEEVQPNEDAMGPYAFKGNQWVGYDDENIVRKKSEYVAKNDLGGIMFWAIDNDDFRGNCHGRPYPLIEAAKEALLNAYGMTDENLIAPPSKPLKTKSKSRTRTQKTTTTTEAPEDISATKSSARRRRIKTKQKEEEDKIVSASSPKRRKTQKSETSSYSSLRVTTPTWTTPPPPATPDTGGAFKCEEEGFFAHPKDCKKYFWCLAGAGDSGIVAHQFTCPAGLYFNKAADSCDYTQNVLCNKKVLKTTTTAKTTTTEESDSDSSTTSTTLKSSILSGLFSTTRPPPKITAATSRTTFLSRTTTEVAEEEYDDEEYEDEEETDKKSSEEDPKVIKELIELIRKAGGIDQLEKHLKIGGSQGANKPDSTTQSGLSKSLYERVLSKTSKSTLNALRKNTGTTRNSAGPQDEGLSSNDKKPSTSEKGRLQYQNIARKRPTTEKSIDEETKNEYVSQDKEKDKSTKAKNSLEYVNIRRPKSGPSTTEANEENEDSNFSRNKILGESSDKQTNNSEEEPLETNRKSNNVPQYVNIRRQRPSTEGGVVEEKESSTTSKYVSIRRSTTPATFDKEEEQKDSEKSTKGSTLKTGDELFKTTRYQTISRTSTTPSVNEAKGDLEETRRSTPNSVTEDNSDSKSRSTNTSPTSASPIPEKNDVPEQNTITKLDEENISSSSTEEPPITSTAQEKSQNNLESSSEPVKDTKRPSLFRPRPFSTGSSSTTTESAVEATKVSQSNIKFRLRQPSTSTSTEGTLINVRSRIRGSSRFSGSNANDVQPENIAEEKQQVQSTRTRKRVIVTTESNIDYNLEQNRKYRPAELADLSSLTAADINLRGVDFQLRNRRRRPIALTTTTQEPVEGLKKTETLPRKSTNFVNRRRAALKSDDQQNASSELSSTARPNRFFRTTTTKPDDEILESKTSQQVSNLTPRPRKIIRRLRPGSTASLSTTEATISNEISSTTNSAALKRKRISVFRTRKTTAQANGTILDTINAVTDTDGPFTARPLNKVFISRTSRLPFSNQNATNQEEQVEPHVDILNAEEGENIKLSESNIRERSQLNSFAVDKKSGKSKLGSEKFFKGANKEDTQSLEIEGFTVTEAPSFFRTRKIVKKLSTTEPSIDKATITENTRRKIIRRLRPSNQNSFDEKSKDELLNLNKKTKYENEEEKFKENDFSVLLPSSTVQTTETPITRFSHRLSLYTRTTSTTPKNEDDKEDIDVLIEEGDDEEGDDEEGDDEKDKQNQSEERDSKYRIYTSSTVNQTHHFESKVNFNNEMESNFNDGWKENKSMTSAVSKMAVNERNESEMILDTDEQLLNNGKDSEDATKKPLVYKEIERPSYKEKTQENIQQDSFKSEPGRIITTTSKTEEATTDFNLEATTILVDLVNNAAKEKINEITPNDLFLPETSTEIPNEEQNIEINEKQVEVTEKSTSEATQSTTEYTKRSTLRSVQSRPRFGHRKTTDASSVVKSSNIETSSKRNRIFGRGRPTTLRPARPVTLIANRATTPRSSNRFIKKYSSTERSRFRTTEKEVDDEIVDKDTDEQNLENFSSTETNSLSNRRKFGNSPVGIRISTTKLPRIFSKSTESSTAAEDLGIDTEAVKNRNKNLFSKRKMNTPYVPTSTVSVLPEESSSFDKNIGNTTVDFESTTLGSQPMETTDYLTTLHHIFAEVEGGNTNILDSSTETMEPSKTPSNSKVERLIEVNRIVEVSAKEHKIKNHEVEEQTRVETIPTLDRIGEITRITVIKVVDGNNKTVVENLENNEINNKSEVSLEANELLHPAKIEEIPNPLSGQSVNLMNSDFDISLASSNREERKFEIFGGSKVSNDKTAAAFPEIIDGRSHINVITSRPFINSETSTISLESLFVSEKGHLNPSFSNIDEILETDKSEFVNVRVLNDKKIDKVPIIQTLDDEDATIQAQVLEVTQKPNARTFKIVPIRVETAKNVAVSN